MIRKILRVALVLALLSPMTALGQDDDDDGPVGGPPVEGGSVGNEAIGGEPVYGDAVGNEAIGGEPVYGDAVGNEAIGGEAVTGDAGEDDGPIGGEPLY